MGLGQGAVWRRLLRTEQALVAIGFLCGTSRIVYRTKGFFNMREESFVIDVDVVIDVVILHVVERILCHLLRISHHNTRS